MSYVADKLPLEAVTVTFPNPILEAVFSEKVTTLSPTWSKVMEADFSFRGSADHSF